MDYNAIAYGVAILAGSSIARSPLYRAKLAHKLPLLLLLLFLQLLSRPGNYGNKLSSATVCAGFALLLTRPMRRPQSMWTLNAMALLIRT